MPTTLQTDTQAILNQVSQMHAFYADNWYHMLVFMGIALAIIGVLIPFLSQWIQYRSFRMSVTDTESKMNKKLDTLFTNTITQLKIQITEEIKKEQTSSLDDFANKFKQQTEQLQNQFNNKMKQLERDLNMTIAGVFQVQANMPDNGPRLMHAISWAEAARRYLDIGNVEDRLQTAINRIIHFLQQSTKKEYDDMLKYTNSSTIEDLLKDLENANINKQYNHPINDIKQEFNNAKTRV